MRIWNNDDVQPEQNDSEQVLDLHLSSSVDRVVDLAADAAADAAIELNCNTAVS